jgi:hypothetical protein
MKRSLLTIICFLLIRQEEVAVVAAAAALVVVAVVAAFWRGQNNNDDDDNNDFNERPFPFPVQLKSIIYFVPSQMRQRRESARVTGAAPLSTESLQ